MNTPEVELVSASWRITCSIFHDCGHIRNAKKYHAHAVVTSETLNNVMPMALFGRYCESTN
ncbi:MAG: hypothetical protein K0B11_17300 [Mariniphaga sp.]|nr:hypothetical protein [Mariniphaga sp.]